MILYYSSTGNCLDIARNLDDNIISIPQAIKHNQYSFEDEMIGLVVPDYSSELPRTVKSFLEKATLKADYIYVVITYGKYDCEVAEYTVALAKENGITIDYANTLLMVDNWLPSFDMEEEMAIDKKIPEQLAVIKEDIINKKHFVKKGDENAPKLHVAVLKRNTDTPQWTNGTALKCDTSKCIGCGICNKVCPVGRNILENGKRSECKHTCDFCLGCIHACPQNAFYLTLPEKNENARFRNPNVSIVDIMNSNNQL